MQHPILDSDRDGRLTIPCISSFACWQSLNDLAAQHPAAQWAVDELKAQAADRARLDSELDEAASYIAELEDSTDGPIADALKSLGWVPPGDLL